MPRKPRQWHGAVAAALAGTVAAVITYLLIERPQWRKTVLEAGRHLLNIADGMLHRRLEGRDE
jgi:hypothetical protein